jgi:hypothetical protein
VVKPADLGRRLRVRIEVDSNQANKKPDPVEVFSPMSAVVTPPPPPPADPAPQGGGGDPQPQPQPQVQAAQGDTSAPALGGVSVAKGAQLKLTLSEPARVTIVVQRVTKKKKCKKGKKCTVLKTVSTSTVSASAGARTFKLAKKKLARGDYRAVITAVDAAGNKTARTVTFKVKK